MIADTDAVYEYLPNSPCVAERVILFNQDAEAALKRILSRLGVTPKRSASNRAIRNAVPARS